ncbi:MAG: biliverdin-producing heme oxygenase [Betaproteobacteria bacterium]
MHAEPALPPDPLARLKAGTDDLHLQLDRHSRMSRLLAPDLQVHEYATILQRLLACQSEIEPVLDTFHGSLGSAVPEWLVPAIYRRSGDLMADLQALGYTASATGDITKPSHITLLEINSLAQAAGCLYVLAGSSLGARVIERRLREHPGTLLVDALRYFSPQAEQAGWSWPAYRQTLNAVLCQPSDEHAALHSARAVFGCFLRHMALAS